MRSVQEVIARHLAGPRWDKLANNPNSQHEYVEDAVGIVRALNDAGYIIAHADLVKTTPAPTAGQE